MLGKAHLVAEDVLDGRGPDCLVVVEGKDDGWAVGCFHLAVRASLTNDPITQGLGLQDTEKLLRLQGRELGHVDDLRAAWDWHFVFCSAIIHPMAESKRQDTEQPKAGVGAYTGDVDGGFIRTPADQRRLLVATIRDTSEWRGQKAREFSDDAIARKRSLRAKLALRTLANFVEAIPDDDPDLNLHALRRVGEREGELRLAPDSVFLLSRFSLDKGAWQSSKPSERQMRNILRRIDGVEARERHARKQRADMGYGDE